MINEKTTFKEYLKESGYDLVQYINQVSDALYKIFNQELDYSDFYDDIVNAFNNKIEINKIAAEIASNIDTEYFTDDNEYSQDQLDAFADYPQDSFDDLDESTDNKKDTDDGVSDGESYKDWKLNVFNYIDKRVDVNKIADLGKYIKDYIKQEYNNGEPSWFGVAESIVNYTRINYPSCIKNRIPFNLDEGFFNIKKYHSDPYYNKVFKFLVKFDIDVDRLYNQIVDFIEDFKKDDYSLDETCSIALGYFRNK